jgi:hypothetical protein
MKYEILKTGFIYKNSGGPIACTSRCAVGCQGSVICSFMTQSGLSMNDFVPNQAISYDNGITWKLLGPIWPQLSGDWSINNSISSAPNGDLFLLGSRTTRTRPGESFWCQKTLGILPNEMIWARSKDDGKTWSPPSPLKTPLPGAMECPAPLCVTKAGRWLAPYSPHNTFDPSLKVDLQHVVIMISDDQGASWRYVSAIRVDGDQAYVAESWITQLSDGRILATTWHLNRSQGNDYPNAYALSSDDGQTWGPTLSTGIMGQSAGLAPLPDGKVLFVYNQRRHGTPGVWLAVAKPGEKDFGVLFNAIAWNAEVATQNNSSGKSTNWTDFAFGEPSVTILPDNTALVAFWCIQPSGGGIGCVKVKLPDCAR